MEIGSRLRQLREVKNLSQGHIEQKTGLLRCYLSRVECGHTVPSISTLEKWAVALEVPLYQLFYEGTDKPKMIAPEKKTKLKPRQNRLLKNLTDVIPKLTDRDGTILLQTARNLARK